MPFFYNLHRFLIILFLINFFIDGMNLNKEFFYKLINLVLILNTVFSLTWTNLNTKCSRNLIIWFQLYIFVIINTPILVYINFQFIILFDSIYILKVCLSALSNSLCFQGLPIFSNMCFYFHIFLKLSNVRN